MAMWAMIVKEFRQLRRDRRTLAMMIFLPVLLLIIFGYAARFDVKSIGATVVGPRAAAAAKALRPPFEATTIAPGESRGDAVKALRDGRAPVAFVTGASGTTVLLDGSQLFTATAAKAALAEQSSRTAHTAQAAQTARLASPAHVSGRAQPAQPFSMRVDVLFNPGLKTSDIMVPGLAGLILLFVGMIITSLGVVRERQAGTLEQLAVMPLRPRDVFLGKIAPYFLVAAVDLAIVVTVGVALFSVPFRGSVAVFALGAVLFLFVTLGMGVLISSVSQTQGQAIQLAIMAMLPQIMLSGLIFPLSSMAPGVRWIGFLLPLTYFTEITRGVMLRGAPIGSLWEPFLYLALIGAVVTALATLRFRRFLAPAPRRERPGPPGRRARVAAVGAEQ
jgi:ABC transporter DrrB family efflux protein